jgi:hypothetical protein
MAQSPEAPINALVQLSHGTQALLRHVHLSNSRLKLDYIITVKGRNSRRQVRRAMARVALSAVRLDLATNAPTRARLAKARQDAKWLDRHLLGVAAPPSASVSSKA